MDTETLIILIQELKSLVDRYGANSVKDTLDFIEKVRVTQAGVDRSLYSKAGAYTVVSSVLYNQIRDAAVAGRKADAIKLLLTYTKLGVTEAKDIVEDNFM